MHPLRKCWRCHMMACISPDSGSPKRVALSEHLSTRWCNVSILHQGLLQAGELRAASASKQLCCLDGHERPAAAFIFANHIFVAPGKHDQYYVRATPTPWSGCVHATMPEIVGSVEPKFMNGSQLVFRRMLQIHPCYLRSTSGWPQICPTACVASRIWLWTKYPDSSV